MFNKKGAMFGLDARIALVIFGTLSLISGASLYSSAQKAKLVSIENQIKEISNALEQYHLDTRTNIRRISEINSSHSNKDFGLYSKDLITNNNIHGWHGPYISLQTHSIDPLTVLHNSSILYIPVVAEPAQWGGTTGTIPCSTNSKTCSIWIQVGHLKETELKALDILYDSQSSPNKGLVRIRNDAPTFGFINTTLPYKNY